MPKFVVISGLFVFVLILLAWRIHTAVTTYYITAKFREMRPLPHHIQVLYKGLKIGNVVSIRHSDDFESTLIKLRLPKKIKLPSNVAAHLMIEKRRFHDYDYIEIVKPSIQSEDFLVAGSEIQGIAMIDSRNFFANQNKETLESVRDNLHKASENLNTTIEGLGELFILLQDVVKENKSAFRQASKNISAMTDNLSDTTRKINNAVVEEQLKESLNNVDNSISNLNSISAGINKLTYDINQDYANVSPEIKNIVNNVDDITTGVVDSLRKPFGGFRVMFGRNIDKCN